MGQRNYLVDGGSGSGKTSVATALEQRGFFVVHGDRNLAYQGDPQTGALVIPRPDDVEFISAHHIWDLARVKAITADQQHEHTFFCGAARNRHLFLHLFDAVFVLEADWEIINRRLDGRPNEWGSEPAERALIHRLYLAGADSPPNAIPIDATQPLEDVVDAILARTSGTPRNPAR